MTTQETGARRADEAAAESGVCPYLEVPESTTEDPEWRTFTATLEATPYKVEVGDTVRLSGAKFAPGARVDLVWYSVEGRYESQGGTELIGQRYETTSRVVATTVAGAEGDVHLDLTIPSDFGGPHDIRASVDGYEVAQTGVFITPTFSMTPEEGPVGTAIDLEIVGVDMRLFCNTWHLLWDNKYLGLITAVTTHGVARARFRAAGPVGRHFIEVWNNSFVSSPYLAWDRSPFRDEFDVPAEFTFNVTADAGALPPSMEDFSATDDPWPVEPIGAGRLVLSVDRATVGEPVRLSGEALPPNTDLALIWRAANGDRVGFGISEIVTTMATVRTDAAGRFAYDFDTPSDLGGNHRIEVRQGADALAYTNFIILPSLLSYTRRARVGEKIAVHLKGTGWTTCDNTYSVTYDNSHIGYACAFSTRGDMQFTVTATGTPGTHLLDLYPNMYKGADATPNVYARPQLTYAEDHPQRTLPAIRLTIEVTE
ncbi:MAG: hypothetical protein WC273_07550 [Dehalococcoidia bacterium]